MTNPFFRPTPTILVSRSLHQHTGLVRLSLSFVYFADAAPKQKFQDLLKAANYTYTKTQSADMPVDVFVTPQTVDCFIEELKEWARPPRGCIVELTGEIAS